METTTQSDARTEPTLEECRSELKSMFPRHHTDAWATGMQNQPAFVVRVRGAHFFGDQLSECMAKARDWQAHDND